MLHHADLVVRNARIVTPAGVVHGDLAVQSGTIAAIGEASVAGDEELDAGGCWVMPGGVDPHAHIEQMSGMGLMNADTFETATKSAIFGGTTTVISFAAQAPGQRLSEAISDYRARAERGAMIDHAFHLIISDMSVKQFEVDLAQAVEKGHRSIKIFTTYNIGLDDREILKVLTLAREYGALVCVHAENDAIIASQRAKLLAGGHVSPRNHARSRPRVAEIEAVARICRFAEYAEQAVMLFHISTREAIEELRRARTRGAPVWAETCPHYLFMTEEVLDRPDGGKWMCSPPQREKSDQEALWQGLKCGDLQLVSSDHAPYRYDETGKLSAGPNPPFHEIANGLPGLETRLPLLFNAMVTEGRGGPELFAEVTSAAPAKLHGLSRKGCIDIGYDADLVVWNPNRCVTYGADDLHDNVGYNPWEGHIVTGWPETVIQRGAILMRNDQFLGQAGQGIWQARSLDDMMHSLRGPHAEN